jgi:hypothetical protein
MDRLATTGFGRKRSFRGGSETFTMTTEQNS